MNYKINPPHMYQGFIVLMILLHFFYPIRQIVQFPYTLAGVFIFMWGVWFALKAKKLFKDTGTPIKPGETPQRVIDSGPFEHTRNPMYLGITIGLLGIAILLGSLSAFYPPVIFFLIMNFVYVPLEEKTLAKSLGSDWEEYKSKVRRWI